MTGLRILITNICLNSRTGTETYVRDLAVALQRHGQTPIVYSSLLGEMAWEIRSWGIPVLDDLAMMACPPRRDPWASSSRDYDCFVVFSWSAGGLFLPRPPGLAMQAAALSADPALRGRGR